MKVDEQAAARSGAAGTTADGGREAPAHVFDATILREYDIRGIVGETLTERDAEALGRACATLVRRERAGMCVALGRDGRLSSPALARALARGLTAGGLDVLDIGEGPTPMLYFAVHHLGVDGGIMVTGSHNPPDYNGFKMMIGKAPLFGERIRELGRIAAEADWEPVSRPGRHREASVTEEYVARLVEGADGLPPLSVVWDPGNGAAGVIVERLAMRLPGRHVVINARIDGHFPNHHPDPTVEANLEQLKRTVAETGADLGLAFDGDGDRIGAVDGRGRVIWGDQILLILARHLLRERPGATIIADVKASRHLFEGVRAAGGEPLMWKTGHSLIKTKMVETDAALAGEMSGHIFFRHRYYGFDDALYAAVRLIEAIGADGRTPAEILDSLPVGVATPELRFDCPEADKRRIVEAVAARLAEEGARVSRIDGVRVDTADGWWLLRASNTQPVLVARAEADDEAGLARLKEALVGHLRAVGLEPTLSL